MSLYWRGSRLACEVCGHVETGRNLDSFFGKPVYYGDFICRFWVPRWRGDVRGYSAFTCHWCAARLQRCAGWPA